MSIQSEESKKLYLEYLFNQYKKKLLDKQGILKLIEAGYIKTTTASTKEDYTSEIQEDDIDLFESSKSYILETSHKNIKIEDWMPKSNTKHSKEFKLWIDSQTLGYFPLKCNYKLFNNYKAQALRWLETYESPNETDDEEDRRNLVLREFRRCNENTLYFAMRYGFVKEGSSGEGIIKYKPKEHNAVILYLLDCGYSLILGKPRQIFSSTTVGLFALKKILFTYNFYTKFISENEDTAEEIFRDKIKYPFMELPDWMKPEVSADSLTGFRLGAKVAKGKYDKPNSMIDVVPPSNTAVNGGSPPLVLVDEIGNIPNIIEMVTEAIPTMFIDKNSDGNLQLKRQLCLWGTGVSSDKGSAAYEKFWTHHLKLWQEGDDGIFIPLFFSWHTRCTTAHYKKMKAFYNGGQYAEQNNVNVEISKKMFSQHFPSKWMDMFSLTSETLVSNDIIAKANANIRQKFSEGHRLIWGYFEPKFDTTKKYQENFDIQYYIRDVEFIPVDDDDSALATCAILVHPDKNSKNRYFQGTDPIAHETGMSKFASCVWDKKEKAPVAILNFRKQYDNEYCFLQSMCLGIYYDTDYDEGQKRGVPELVEGNIGTIYTQYKQNRGYGKRLVLNSELPTEQRGGGSSMGIDNRSMRHIFIVEKLKECILNYYNKIFFDIIFVQLNTFVRNDRKNSVSWGTFDKRAHADDVLFALVYAYICSEIVYQHKQVSCLDDAEKVEKRKAKYVIKDNGKGLTREMVYL